MDFNAVFMECFLQKVPDTETRQKLCWTAARLFRVAQTHKVIIGKLLEDSSVINAELLVKILESSWKWDYNFVTHEFSPPDNIIELQNTKDETLVLHNTRLGSAKLSATIVCVKETETAKKKELFTATNDLKSDGGKISQNYAETSSEYDTPVGGSDVSLSDVSSDAESIKFWQPNLTNRRNRIGKQRGAHSESQEKSPKKKPVTCHLCARPFCGKSATSSLLRHLREYHINNFITCEVCFKKYANPRSYEHHKKTAHDPNYYLKCRKEWCSRIFKYYRTRNEHEATCVNDKNKKNKSKLSHKN